MSGVSDRESRRLADFGAKSASCYDPLYKHPPGPCMCPADGKEMMTRDFEDIEHKYNVQKESSKLESSNGSHETCMIEIEMGRRERWEAKAKKEEKQEDC